MPSSIPLSLFIEHLRRTAAVLQNEAAFLTLFDALPATVQTQVAAGLLPK